MENQVNITGLKRDSEGYNMLCRQVDSLLEGETDRVANLANVSAALMEFGRFHWVGFYLVQDEELVLGPFQGPVACTRIAKNRGACGTSWAQDKTLVLDNVHTFADHIACSPYSNAEIVIPLHAGGAVIGVLDIDSTRLADFTAEDRSGLEDLVRIIEKHL